MPSTTMSSTYRPRPVRRRRSSTRRTLLPTYLPVSPSRIIGVSSQVGAGGLGSGQDRLVAGAPAQVPGQLLAELVAVRTGAGVQQAVERHDEARGAERAL